MKRSFNDSPESPPPLRLQWGNEEPDSPRAEEESLLECKEEMPASNLKRKRVLPPMFFQTLPEKGGNKENEENGDTESDDSLDEHRDELARMQLAVQLVFNDIEERQAENRRETADYNEGDTPQTSQESKLSDYNWSLREGADVVSLGEIVHFVWKHLPRPQIYKRVMPFLSLTEEMYQRDAARVEELVKDVLDCEPVALLNILEDAIEEAEKELGPGVHEKETLPDSEGDGEA